MSSFQPPVPVHPALVRRAHRVRGQGVELHNKLFEERIVFLGVQVDDAS